MPERPPPPYADWSLRDIAREYGHRPEDCPDELRPWLRLALEAMDLARLERNLRVMETARAMREHGIPFIY